MDLLDMRTVIISYIISSMLCALMLIALWRQNRRQPGIAFWVADAVMRVAGLLLIALRSVIPDFWSMVVANLLLVGGAMMMLLGLQRFVGRISSQRYNYAFLALFVGVQTYFALVQPSLQMRNVNLAFALIFYCSQCVWLLMRGVAPAMRSEVRPFGVVLAAFVLASAVRILVELAIPPGPDLFVANSFGALIVLTYQMLHIALTFAFVLTLNRRLVRSLEADMVEREQAFAALRDSEEKFAKAFQTAPYAITLTRTTDGKIIDVNDAFVTITGFSRAEALATSTIQLQVWARTEDRDSVVAALANGQPIVGWEFEFRNKSGELFAGAISARLIQLSSESYIFSSIEDITARKQADQALRESQERLELVLEGSQLGFWDWNIATGEVYRNARWAEMLGYTLDEVQSTIEQWTDLHHPDDRAAAWAAITAHLEGWTPAYKAEYRMLAKDGQYRWILDQATIVRRDESGKPLRMSGTHTDITARKLAEVRREQEAMLANFRAEASEGLNSGATLDAALQRCVDAAVRHLGAALARIWLFEPPAAMLALHASAGLSARLNGSHAQIPLGKLKVGVIAAEHTPHLTNALMTDPLIEDQAWVQNEGLVAFAGYPLLVGSRLVGILAMFARQPIAEELFDALAFTATTIADGVARRQAEQSLQASETALALKAAELERSNSDLERFAYVVSHDLQEPLRMVSLFINLLAKEYGGRLDATADEYIQFAVDGAKRMHRQIQDLLAYSRIQTRGGALYPTSAESALAAALWNLEVAIEEAGATVTHDPLPAVQADAAQLTQVFQNLVGNAVKFRRTVPPHVHIAAHPMESGDSASHAWEFTVADNGIGIDPECYERIFGVFQRLHTEQQYPGTGIGLAICQRIVERHQGKIWVESTPGAGSTFYFTLPAA